MTASGKPANGEEDSLPGLLPHHVKDLRASGLSDGTIKAAGIFSEQNHQRIASILNRKTWSRKSGPALVFPFKDETGVVVLQRVKPDNPQTRNGKPAKYLSPSGSSVRAYIPTSVLDALADTKRVLLITEGEKKALKATQEGFPCIGLTGVDCWHAKRSSALIPDLERIKWSGRLVYIAFDSDADENPNVRDNICLLASALKKRGANVKVVWLPSEPGGPKVGLDDFLVKHGKGGLRRALGEAEEPEPPDPGTEKLSASESDPATVARLYLESLQRNGFVRLRYWRETYWFWQRGRFIELPVSEVRANVVNFVDRIYCNVSQSVISNVLEHVRAQSILSSRREPPSWLKNIPGSQWSTDELLIAKNLVVHLPSLLADVDYSVAPSPGLFSTTALDYDFVAGDCPRPDRWLQFLDDLWSDDADAIEALQWWFGYCLTPDTRQQKMLAIFGPRRSGKGTIARVQTALIGADNVASPTLASFSNNFGLWPLVGKSVAIISDARLSGRSDAAVITERILSITGEDSLTLDRKYLPPITCRLGARLVLISNELPRLSDASGALVGRMIVLRLSRSWYGDENLKLTDELIEELPGILWWAIDGWRKLREHGRLLQPASGAEMLGEWEDLASPVGTFLRECCDVGPEFHVPRAALYSAYKRWSESHGRKHVEDEAGFGRNLHAAVPGLGVTHPRIDGNKVRCHVGVALKVLADGFGTGGTCS